LKEVCPDGIDGHFENVGGMILDAVLLHSNSFARVALCGMISRYGQPIPITQTQHILMNRMRLEAFVISEHMEVWPDALKELGTLVATGKLSIGRRCPSLETAPEALIGLFKGRNFGKQLVKLA
jgi:NADPH-dependent curcumin reductase CurA